MEIDFNNVAGATLLKSLSVVDVFLMMLRKLQLFIR